MYSCPNKSYQYRFLTQQLGKILPLPEEKSTLTYLSSVIQVYVKSSKKMLDIFYYTVRVFQFLHHINDILYSIKKQLVEPKANVMIRFAAAFP